MASYSPWDRKEVDTAERLHFPFFAFLAYTGQVTSGKPVTWLSQRSRGMRAFVMIQ